MKYLFLSTISRNHSPFVNYHLRKESVNGGVSSLGANLGSRRRRTLRIFFSVSFIGTILWNRVCANTTRRSKSSDVLSRRNDRVLLERKGEA